MLLDPGGSKRLTVTPHGNGQLVVGQMEACTLFHLVCLSFVPLRFSLPSMSRFHQGQRGGAILDGLLYRDLLVLKVDGICPALKVANVRSLGPDRLESGAKLERSNRSGRQQWREGKVRTWRNDNGLVFARIEGSRNRVSGPATSKHNHSFAFCEKNQSAFPSLTATLLPGFDASTYDASPSRAGLSLLSLRVLANRRSASERQHVPVQETVCNLRRMTMLPAG